MTCSSWLHLYVKCIRICILNIFSNQGYLELLKVSGSLPVFVISHSSASWEADGYAISSVHF